MSRKTNTWNAYETTLGSGLLAGSSSVLVADTAQPGLVAPFYVVLEPDIPSRREWIKVNTVTATAFENIDRGLEGSAGPSGVGVDHAVDSIVRAVFTKQLQDDLFADIADGVTAADATYLKLAGGTMAGNIDMGGKDVRNITGIKSRTAEHFLIYGPTGAYQIVLYSTGNINFNNTSNGATLYWSEVNNKWTFALKPSIPGYLPLSGGTMTGILDMGGSSLYGLQTIKQGTGSTFILLDDVAKVRFVMRHSAETGAGNIDFRNADGTPTLAWTETDNQWAFRRSVIVHSTTALAAGVSNTSDVDGYHGMKVETTSVSSSTRVLYLQAGGVPLFTVWADGRLHIPGVYSATTSVTSNVVVEADGRLRRSTSARKYKSDIKPAPQLADLALTPVTFYHEGDDDNYAGFIADDIAGQYRDAGVFGNKGQVEDYDTRAVVAILAAKVNRLEEKAGV